MSRQLRPKKEKETKIKRALEDALKSFMEGETGPGGGRRGSDTKQGAPLGEGETYYQT